MKPQHIGLLSGIVLTVPACLIAFVSSGAGHGDYFLFKLVYPITMLSTFLFGSITAPFILIGLAQFPLYGYLVGLNWRSPTRRAYLWKLAGVHGILALLAVLIPNSSFS